MSLRLGEREALFAVSAVLVLVPFFVVTFPPITDLPQHLAQIRLLGEAVADPGGPYRIQWWTPYGLSYALLLLCRAIAPPLSAGRLMCALVALLWVVTAHALAAKRGRSPLAAVLASLFVFGNVLYWGFLSFALGWPLFAAWMHLTSREARGPSRLLLLTALGLALYWCHALWLLAAVAWTGVVTIADVGRRARERGALGFRSLRPQLVRAGALAPAVVALALWTPGFQDSGMRTAAFWKANPLTRLTPEWLVHAVLGGLRGPFEGLALSVVAVWVFLGIAAHRGRLREAVDSHLLLAASLLGLFALVLPDSYMTTIELPQRWMPSAATLLLLGLPAPPLRPVLLRIAVVSFVAVFVAVTAVKWVAFERDELAGLSETLEKLPAESRVLGLDYQQKSEYVRARPFLQIYAWAQVLKGGTLDFSFASFATSPVVFRSHAPRPWTPRLYWFPRRLLSTDLEYFDYVIVNGTPDVHEGVVAWRRLAPVTTTGRWRLYRVEHSDRSVSYPLVP
jgi:hypothetical protein